jgi:hypothetical protein
MVVALEDLVAYACVNLPEDDLTTSGGAIDEKMRVHFDVIPVPGPLRIASDSASDVAEITVQGRTITGEYVEGAFDLDGLNIIEFGEAAYGYLLKVTMDADAIGTVTITAIDGTTETILTTIPPGERGFTSMFFKAVADPLAEVVRYEKFFWKNTHGTDDLRGVLIVEDSDLEDVMTHAPSLAKNDSVSVADRLTAPSSLVFKELPRNIINTNLNAGEAIGVWLKQTLPAGELAFFSTYTAQIKGRAE